MVGSPVQFIYDRGSLEGTGEGHTVVECKEDTELLPGTWYLWKTGKQKVFLACPVCGGIALVDVDDVEEDGRLVKAFWCRVKGCLFFEEIVLAGWRVVKP